MRAGIRIRFRKRAETAKPRWTVSRSGSSMCIDSRRRPVRPAMHKGPENRSPFLLALATFTEGVNRYRFFRHGLDIGIVGWSFAQNFFLARRDQHRDVGFLDKAAEAKGRP